MDGTVVEVCNLTQFMILIVIVFLIFRGAQITITIKSKIKRVKVAKHSLNSMAVGMAGCGGRRILSNVGLN